MDMQAKQKIYDGLKEHYGSIQEVVDRTERLKEGGFSRETIRRVLTMEEYNNIEILNICAEVLEEYQQKQAHQMSLFNAALERLSVTA